MLLTIDIGNTNITIGTFRYEPGKPAKGPLNVWRLHTDHAATADEYHEKLAPAIDRVWTSEIQALRTDLRGWLQRLLDGGTEWVPVHAELGIGFGPGDGRDPASIPAPVTLDGGWQLHGIIDLVERQANGTKLRVTDHKTGRARTEEGVVVGGGEALQPILYGLALERATAREYLPRTIQKDETALRAALLEAAYAKAYEDMTARGFQDAEMIDKWAEFSMIDTDTLCARAVLELHAEIAVTRDYLEGR
jgi:hypothetical protein